jgi:superfamily II DNA/RNA helicase
MNAGVRAGSLHGARTQVARQRTLEDFKRGKVQVLVATDVAARGIHVDDVSLVVHYDLPDNDKDYLHRSGRTGRAGRDGKVIAFVPPSRQRVARRLVETLSYDIIWDQGTTPADRAPRGDRPARTERPTYRDRAGHNDRPGQRDNRFESRGDRPSQNRPAYGNRDARPGQNRPAYGNRDARPGQDRPAYGNRDARPGQDRPAYGDRARSDRPAGTSTVSPGRRPGGSSAAGGFRRAPGR